MRAVVSTAEMRSAEEEAGRRGLSAAALMQLAGQGAARAILEHPGASRLRYLVLVGPGNNGGDALVVASLLGRAGAAVQLATYHRSGAAKPGSKEDSSRRRRVAWRHATSHGLN